ncbi:uncharacterized protein BcabD6B2_50070 [Babesia caballi]|uniref:Secreted protein n=1 Tax=Babesia caballi TaxID=5871 RepID=A0AAV4LZB5_BABCB|nr:hypothetical protein BcabD6B2_50070 [Babesia caballi]
MLLGGVSPLCGVEAPVQSQAAHHLAAETLDNGDRRPVAPPTHPEQHVLVAHVVRRQAVYNGVEVVQVVRNLLQQVVRTQHLIVAVAVGHQERGLANGGDLHVVGDHPLVVAVLEVAVDEAPARHDAQQRNERGATVALPHVDRSLVRAERAIEALRQMPEGGEAAQLVLC